MPLCGDPRSLAVLLALAAGLTACAGTPAVRFQAIYVDLDGTALGADDHVRAATVDALARYRACGGHVGIATGRSPRQVASAVAALRPDLPLVLTNGAVVTSPDGGRVREVARLAPGVRERALALLRTNADVISLIVVHDLDEVIFDRPSPSIDAWTASGDAPPWRIDADLAWTRDDEPIKLLVRLDPDAAEPVAAALGADLGDRAWVVVSHEGMIEVLPPGVNKAAAIRRVLAALGLDPADTVAFGDGDNDVEMLSQLGLGVAMGNARPRAGAAADIRIGPNDTDAIAAFVDAVVLGPACGRDDHGRTP